jgi:hypothetical protein
MHPSLTRKGTTVDLIPYWSVQVLTFLLIPHGYVVIGDQLQPQDGLKAWCPKDGVVLTVKHKPGILTTVQGRTSSKRANFSPSMRRLWEKGTPNNQAWSPGRVQADKAKLDKTDM